MTRKTAIRLLAGLAGVFGHLVKGQSSFVAGNRPLAEIIFGRLTAKAKAEYEKCLVDGVIQEQREARKRPGGPEFVWGCFEPSEYERGTAFIRLNLSELEAIEITLDGQTRRITRQELWEALQ